jgi:hypothetical protein
VSRKNTLKIHNMKTQTNNIAAVMIQSSVMSIDGRAVAEQDLDTLEAVVKYCR